MSLRDVPHLQESNLSSLGKSLLQVLPSPSFLLLQRVWFFLSSGPGETLIDVSGNPRATVGRRVSSGRGLVDLPSGQRCRLSSQILVPSGIALKNGAVAVLSGEGDYPRLSDRLGVSL